MKLTDKQVATAREVHQQFAALMVGSRVEKDGQVEGFRSWWTSQHEGRQILYDRVVKAATKKVVIEGRSMDDVLPRAVTYLRQLWAKWTPPSDPIPDPVSVSSLIASLGRGLKWPDDAPAPKPAFKFRPAPLTPLQQLPIEEQIRRVRESIPGPDPSPPTPLASPPNPEPPTPPAPTPAAAAQPSGS